ncbi:hypothetical protein IF2G_02968 [Cordyceps javanica]|nr:hypothetical protein IF2G_02968 [Cordyceps javanica]
MWATTGSGDKDFGVSWQRRLLICKTCNEYYDFCVWILVEKEDNESTTYHMIAGTKSTMSITTIVARDTAPAVATASLNIARPGSFGYRPALAYSPSDKSAKKKKKRVEKVCGHEG